MLHRSVIACCLQRPLSAWVLLLAGWLAATAAAQTPAGAPPDLLATAQQWLDQTLTPGNTPSPLRMEVRLGTLDPRLKLAPCQRVEPYLPPGTRLWGATRLGLRCVQGTSRWNAFLPVTVRAWGPAWAVKGTVAPGQVLTDADALAVEVDWAQSASPIVANQADWVGKTPTRTLSTGQALRQDMIRAAQVFAAGAQVRVSASGTGFEVVGRGQAISAGVVGQIARVRMDNGQILSGVVADDRTVRVLL